MKVYVGKFRYIYDGDTDVIVATTQERIEQELIKMAEQYTEYLDEDERNSLGKANTFNEWNDIGSNNESNQTDTFSNTQWRQYDSSRRPCKNNRWGMERMLCPCYVQTL